jgi:hypothetical protein
MQRFSGSTMAVASTMSATVLRNAGSLVRAQRKPMPSGVTTMALSP